MQWELGQDDGTRGCPHPGELRGGRGQSLSSVLPSGSNGDPAQPQLASASPSPAATEILLQVGCVELWDPPVGNLFLWTGTLPQAGEHCAREHHRLHPTGTDGTGTSHCSLTRAGKGIPAGFSILAGPEGGDGAAGAGVPHGSPRGLPTHRLCPDEELLGVGARQAPVLQETHREAAQGAKAPEGHLTSILLPGPRAWSPWTLQGWEWQGNRGQEQDGLWCCALALWRWGSSLPPSRHGPSTHHTAQGRLPWDRSPLAHRSGECRPRGSRAHTPCAQPQERMLHVGSLQAATPSDGRQDWTSPLTGG